jgi:hypothetical protein
LLPKHYAAARPPFRRLPERGDVQEDKKLALIDLKTTAHLVEQKLLADAAIDSLLKATEAFPAVT